MFKPESAQATGNLRFAQDSATLIHFCEQANTCAAIIDLSGRYLAKTSDCSQRFGQQQTAAHIGETHLADILAGRHRARVYV